MKRALATMIALAICAATQGAAAQDDDDTHLDDPEAGLTGDEDDGSEDDDDPEDGDGDDDDEPPPDYSVDDEASTDDIAAFITLRHIQVGANVGYGISLESGNFDPFGVALGLHAGVTLESNLHVGLFFNYHLGEGTEADFSDTTTVPPTAYHETLDYAFHHYGLKVGWDVELLDSIVGRPLAILGIQHATIEHCRESDCNSNAENDVLFGLGGELLYLGDGFYVGPELRWNISLGDPAVNSLSMLLGGGVSF